MSTSPRVPCCPECGSAQICADAATRWSVVDQRWEVTNVFDQGMNCDDCEAEFDNPEWREAGQETIHPVVVAA